MSNIVKVIDAGHRERMALIAVWDSEPQSAPLWKWFEDVKYDASRDEFIWPSGRTMTLQEALQKAMWEPSPDHDHPLQGYVER